MKTRMMKNELLLFLFLLFAWDLATADEVDQLVERFMEKKHVPGLALLVVHDGQIVKSKGYGYANLEHQVPVKPETIFQSGSMGKQFTATAVMMLMEEGKISLDDPPSKFIGPTPPEWKGITIRHLLTHTSGLGDYPGDFDFRKDYTEDQMIEIVKKQPLKFKPGEQWNYSNLAYLTLGVIIHKASGKFYGDFLQERVFQPLGMTSTRIINEAEIIPNRAAGYEWVNEKHKNQDWVAPTINTTADGSMYFTIVDLAKWDAALYTEKLLKASSLKEMWTPVKLNDGSTYDYGFGWGMKKVGNHRLIEHGGAWQGFTTQICRYVDDKLTVAVLTNLAGGGPGYIAHTVAAFYEPEVALPKHTAVELSPDVLRSYTGEYKMDDRGFIIKVTAEGNKLIAELPQQKVELIPESETSFFVEYSETGVKFAKNDQGQISDMVLSVSGTEIQAKKVK